MEFDPKDRNAHPACADVQDEVRVWSEWTEGVV
jgi:hypothetical protein